MKTAREWQAEAQRDPAHLVVMCLKDAPSVASVEALCRTIGGLERVHANDREAYVVHQNGIGRSGVTHALVEARLGTGGTGRSRRTGLRLAVAAG